MCVCVILHMCALSCFQLFAPPWTIALQAQLSMKFSKQEYWSGLPFPYSGDLPNPGIKPEFPTPLALAGRFFTTVPANVYIYIYMYIYTYIYIYIYFFVCVCGVGGNSAPLFFLQNLFEKISWTKVRNRILGSSKEGTQEITVYNYRSFQTFCCYCKYLSMLVSSSIFFTKFLVRWLIFHQNLLSHGTKFWPVEYNSQ